MKILMTSVTTMGCNAAKQAPRIDRLDVPKAIEDLLRRHGHEVERRPVIPGEALPAVDAAWINLGTNPSGPGAKHAPGAFWAVHQAITRGLPTVIFFEDWQLDRIAQGFRYVAKTGPR